MRDADTVYVLFTMDAESARPDVTAHAAAMSGSGPADYVESERSIRGYIETAAAAGFPVTLFAHPEVAAAHAELLLALEGDGVCLGLHLHPYKFADGRHRLDLGAYPAAEQKAILEAAASVWERAIGRRPLYFRGGYFSANDSTFAVLEALGFRGGSLSNPGRVLPSHCSVWKGSDPYPHRAHRGFRELAGDGDFVEVPVSVAFGRPVARGHAGEAGFEWPYIPHTYDHDAVVRDILERYRAESPPFPCIVTDTHNDQDYADSGHPARRNMARIVEAIRGHGEALGLRPVGVTLDALCDLVRA